MTDEELLDRLAGLCGVVSEFRDIWGERRTVSRETKRALLAAMGVRAGSPEDVRREIHAREVAPFRRALPPVLVVRRPAEPIEIPVALPESHPGESFVAVLETEDGQVLERPFRPADLPEIARQEVDGAAHVRRVLALEPAPGLGYHRLTLRAAAGPVPGELRLIVAPARCWTPEGLASGRRVWGPAAQLYALRSGNDWGVGDYGTLRELARICGESGAGILGVNPLHALFPANPLHTSPYSPSSRAHLNWLYLDVEAIPEFAGCAEARRRVAGAEFQARLVALREGELVDWSGVAAAKREVLEILWRDFRDAHLGGVSARGRAFETFVAEGGPALESYGTFEALDEKFRRSGAWGWQAWPEEYRRPGSPAVAAFAAENSDRVGFFEWLQWECTRQLAAVESTGCESGLEVGLYQDLAVSVDRAGFEVWRWQDVFARDAAIGAPPDDFNLQGQDWGLPPWIPAALRESGYRPFTECLRSNMRHAGALRVDHVMGLYRSFWIPPGSPAGEGAYVLYPFEDLLGILALESVRNRCLVIGEDLGTVPDEVREALGPLGVLSYRLLYFQREGDGAFAPPARLPRRSLVAATTHDLPTLAGWWRGRDILLRAELGLYPEQRQREEDLAERSRDRMRLLFALRREGLLEDPEEVDLAHVPDDLTPRLMIAVHRYLARGPSMVLTFQLEDVLGQVEQVNLPGTTDEHPNWCRRLTADISSLEQDPRLAELVAALRGERAPESAPPGGDRRRPVTTSRAAAGIPRATYRLQLHRGFPFARATALVPYLARLGVSHVYASPILQARPGSLHGYDIIDHGRVSEDLGGAEGLERLVDALHRHDMGLVLDLVPNHMGVGSDNAWWMSVLEHGPASPYAAFFDIDWRPDRPALRGRVLLPILEDHYGRVLERGLLKLHFHPDRGAFEVAYHEHRFPVDPGTYPAILSHDLGRLRARTGGADTRILELQSLIDALGNLPGREEGPDRVAARLRDADVLRRGLARLVSGSGEVAAFLEANVARFQGRPDDPASFDLLDHLLDAQVYRLAFWRTAADEINYRRFFDVNDLAGLRQEDPRAFEATHRLVLDLVRRGRVDGLRIDHPDGLHDPAGYYRRLTEEISGGRDDGAPPVWIVAEKILAAHERLPAGWAVHGTTGYDFCSLLGGLFVDPTGERTLDRAYHRFVGRRVDYDELLYDSKRLILLTALASELSVLSDELDRISEADRGTRDFTRQRLRHALAEVIACFPVYRTYVTEASVTAEDRRYVDWAVARARARDRAADTSVYDFLRDVLVLDAVEGKRDDARRAIVRFTQKFQQTTSPVMAKGAEDTAFYSYNRLLALNEVGGEPRRFGVSMATFHRANRERAERWPHSMLCTSTHDTKRSEEVRARIAVLSEIPGRWERAVRRFGVLNRSHRRQIGRRPAPSRNDEYALYQTLLGAWPSGPLDETGRTAFRERIQGWAVKAVREAKIDSSWIEPNEPYERAAMEFVGAILADPDGAFLGEFLSLQRFVAGVAAVHMLAQTLLKLTVPGVPDVYQGQELPELCLVDPDNRRPVDFQRRLELLEELERHSAPRDAAPGDPPARTGPAHDDARAKLWVTWRVLALRRRMPELFRAGEYRPLEAGGERADHVVAFARETGEKRFVVVAPRLVAGFSDPAAGRPPVGEAWGDTWIAAPGDWRDLLGGSRVGGERLAAERTLRRFPAALLVPDRAS